MKYLIYWAALFLTPVQFASLQGMEPVGRVACEGCNRRAIEQQEQDERTALVFKYSPLHTVFACQKRGLPRHRKQRGQLPSTASRGHYDDQSSFVNGFQEATGKIKRPGIDDL